MFNPIILVWWIFSSFDIRGILFCIFKYRPFDYNRPQMINLYRYSISDINCIKSISVINFRCIAILLKLIYLVFLLSSRFLLPCLSSSLSSFPESSVWTERGGLACGGQVAAAPVWSGLWMGRERQLHSYGGRWLCTGSVIKEVSILSIIQASFSFRRIRDS